MVSGYELVYVEENDVNVPYGYHSLLSALHNFGRAHMTFLVKADG